MYDPEGISVEPKVVYRGVSGSKNILDAGANVVLLKDVFNIFGLYHTTKNGTLGAGIRIFDLAQATFMYITQASDLNT